MSYFIEYHRRKANEAIVDYEALRAYCMIYNQTEQRVYDVLTTFARVEYYIRDSEGQCLGAFFLTACEDMHHGNIAVMSAHWLKPQARNRKVHKLVMWYVKRFCMTHGITKYQRTVNLSSSRQLLITKEV